MIKQNLAKRVLAKAVQKQNYLKFLLQVRKFEKFRRQLRDGKIETKQAEWEMIEIANQAEAYLILSER